MIKNYKELLEIFLITYNRSNYLDDTLHQLMNCPFAKFPITILDNCSTDSTHAIFLKYKEDFPKINYLKNKVNIGADANVLRGAELSEGVYTWILADDDEYDFSNCNEVFEILQKGEVAAIMVGCPQMCTWPTVSLCDTPINLIKKNFAYFVVPSFVPSSIFKTDLFQNQIRLSYTNIVNLFPAMTYYIKLYNENKLIYVAKNKIVDAAAKAESHYSFLRVMAGLVNTFYLIDSPSVRQKALDDAYPNLSYKTLVDYALMMKQSSNVMSNHTIFRYFRLLQWRQKLIFLIAYIGAPIITKLTHNYRELYKNSQIL